MQVNVKALCIVKGCCLPEGYNDAISHRSVQLKGNVISRWVHRQAESEFVYACFVYSVIFKRFFV